MAALETVFHDVWQQARDNHARYSATGDKETDIRFFALGLAGEAGELANFVKKRWRDGDGHDAAICFEVADVCAYAFMLADRMGMTPFDLLVTIGRKQLAFVRKMEARADLGLPTRDSGSGSKSEDAGTAAEAVGPQSGGEAASPNPSGETSNAS